METVLVNSTSGLGATEVYGRPLLERILIQCERVGITRFLVEIGPAGRGATIEAMGSFENRDGISLVESFQSLLDGSGVIASEPCLMISDNVVFSRAQLDALLKLHATNPSGVTRLRSQDDHAEGIFATGPLTHLLTDLESHSALEFKNSYLPVALRNSPSNLGEAQRRLALALRNETADSDGILARAFDRRLSWRLSSRLANTRITPNQVTLANTAIGLAAAAMFAAPGYWWRLWASLLFLVSVTIDGVDGEVARLKMAETPFGGMLDKITDNIVNVAIFIGLTLGCYRISGSKSYFYLLGILLIGFGFCAISVARAFSVSGPRAEQFIGKVDRVTGRDFAYILVVLALVNRLPIFAWGAAFGTYVFAFVLWILTDRYSSYDGSRSRSHETPAVAEEV
ncbi:MAG: CDP-alcohol phosphatidyltransferase family protein [Candidatus Binataceae bacterium]|nr:CDP-alcohol phosphatidyltransferase family protein [Candidatus Binataceae bacterium]